MIWGLLAIMFYLAIGWWWILLFYPYLLLLMFVQVLLETTEEIKEDNAKKIQEMKERGDIRIILRNLGNEQQTEAYIKDSDTMMEFNDEHKEDREQFKKKHNQQSCLTSK